MNCEIGDRVAFRFGHGFARGKVIDHLENQYQIRHVMSFGYTSWEIESAIVENTGPGFWGRFLYRLLVRITAAFPVK